MVLVLKRQKKFILNSLRIVEESTVPESMLPSRAVMKEAAVGTIKLVEAIEDIFGGVRVNHVQ